MQIIDPNGYLLCIIELNKPITYDQLSILNNILEAKFQGPRIPSHQYFTKYNKLN